MNPKFLVPIFSLSSILLAAQTTKTYSGPYEQGTATYQYYEGKNGERIYHGPFTYKGLEGTITINGVYKDGKRDGKWVCTLVDYRDTVGTMTGTIQTNYFNGNREGVWTSSLSEDFSGDITAKRTDSVKTTYKDNIAVGDYFYKEAINGTSNAGRGESSIIVKGIFDENGYKTGEWTIQKVMTEEIKKYIRGYCYSDTSRISSTGEINGKFDSTEFSNQIFTSKNEIFKKNNVSYALSKPLGTEIKGFYETLTGTKGVNPFIDNTGDRFAIEIESEGAEVKAQFPDGGDAAWRKFLGGNLRGDVASKNGAPAGSYTVWVQFVVDEEGNVSDVKALTNHGYGMEEEAIRVIKKSPQWKPAIQKGRNVRAYRKQPITFTVEKG